ncbi:unnamed protein product [Closterium sp. NIES-54]
MWIFRVKRPPGSPPAFKARYVARGFSQRQGVDFFQTFSPTPKMTTLRVLLHVAAQRDYELHSLDFGTAFLQGSLHEEIWLRRPPGFTGLFLTGTQWSLRRPVYGLRQAPREWHDTLRTTLGALGFAPSTADPSLFLRTDATLPPFYVLVYVDDLVFATGDTEALAHVKSELQKRHTCTDLGELTSYLGLRVTRDRAQRTSTLTQSHMVQQVLQRFGFTYSSPQSTHLPTGHSLSAPPSDESVEPSGPYPELVGCLMYLITCTRPDLAYPLSLLARYVAPGRHRKVHWDAAKRVLRYLCSTSGMGLVLGGRARVVLTGHADASWADDLAMQRSSQGYTFSLGSGSVSWRSTRSSSVLSSSCEAEIYAGAMAAQELRWLTYLLIDLGEAPRSPPVLSITLLSIFLTGGGGGGTRSGGGGSSGGGGGGSGSGIGGQGQQQPQQQQQQHQRQRQTPTSQQLLDWYAGRGASGGPGRCPYIIRTGPRVGRQCTGFHTEQRCFARLSDAWRAKFPDAPEFPNWAELLRRDVPIFDLDYEAILAAMYALSVSAEGDCYLCVPPDPGIAPGIAPAALGACESAPLGTAPAQALHTFTLDSGASRCFFCDSTTITPLPAPVPVSLADPSGVPVLARSSAVLPCPAVPSGELSSLQLPSFSTNLVSNAVLQDAGVDTFTPGRQRVAICTCSQTGRHLATFARAPGSSLYTLTTTSRSTPLSPQLHASAQVATQCECRRLSHDTLMWHHRLGHPSLPRLRRMHSRVLVSGLPMSLPPLPPSLAPPCIPCVEGRQRAAPHSSFPQTEAPLQTLHLDVWGPTRVRGQGHERYFLLVVDDYTRYTTVFPLQRKGDVPNVLIPWIRATRLQLRERFQSDFPVLRLHSNRGGEFSSALLAAFCTEHGIRQTFTLPASPQKNWVAERRIGLVMEVARTSMVHAAAPHFQWPFAVRYAAHQLNLWPRVSLPETSPTLLWTGKVGDASRFRDVTFDESVPFYRLFPYRTAPRPPSPLFLAPGPPQVDPLPAPGPAPSGVSQVDPPVPAPVEVTGDSGPAGSGAVPGGAELGGAESGGAERVEPGGASSRGTASGGAAFGGAEPVCAEPGSAASGGELPESSETAVMRSPWSSRLRSRVPLTSQQLHDWYGRRRLPTSAPQGSSTGGSSPGVAGPGGARTGSTGAAGAGGGAAGGPGGAGGAGAVGGAGAAGGAGDAGGAGAAGGTAQPRLFFAPPSPSSQPPPDSALRQVLSLPSSTGLPLQPGSPLPAPSPYTEQPGGLGERREPVSRPVSLVSSGRHVPRQCQPAVSDPPLVVRRPSSPSPRVPLPPPPASSLPVVVDPASDRFRAEHSTVTRLLATVVTDPSFESAAVLALVTELVAFAAHCHLDYAASLVAESTSVCPPSVRGECALGTDVLEDRQEDLECLAAAAPHLVSMLLAPEGDPDAPDIPTPRSYVEAIAGSPPVFKARYVARGFSQREGVDFFQNFSPTLKMTTLRVLLHVAAQRDYELHSLDFSTAFFQGSLHKEIWLRRPPGFTGSFPPGTQWSLRQPVYGLRQAPPQATPLATGHSLSAPPSDESVESSGPYPELVGCLMYLMTCTRPYLAYPLGLLACYVAPGRHRKVHMDAAKRVLRYLCSTSGMGLVLGGRGDVVLTGHSDASWVDDQATQRSSQGYTFSLGSGSVSWRSTRSSSVLGSSCEAEIYATAMAAQELRWLTYLLTDLGERPRSPPVLYVDNKAAIALCQEHRTKHIALRYFLARELQQRGQLRLTYVATRANTADIFTKALPPGDH